MTWVVLPCRVGLRYGGWDAAAGAQAGRRGGAGPVGGLLGGKDPTGRFFGHDLDLETTHGAGSSIRRGAPFGRIWKARSAR